MTKANDKAKNNRFTFYYGNYAYSDGIAILAFLDDELYTDVTVNLFPHIMVDTESNEVSIPTSLNTEVYKQFKKQCIDEELQTVRYGNFDSRAKVVRLKPEWKSICKPLND